jgi:RND family efflux transporter MFP subunit
MKSLMSRLGSWIRSHKKLVGGIGILVLIALLVSIFRPRPEDEVFVVDTRDVVDQVVVSGTVELAREIDLSFGISGTIKKVYAKAGDTVAQGALLARQDIAELSSRRARLSALLQKAELEAKRDQITLKATQDRYDQFNEDLDSELKAALLEFYSANLEAVPVDRDTNSVIAPQVSGTFSDFAGITLDNALDIKPVSYTLEVYPSAGYTGYSYRLFGHEKGYGTVSYDHPTPLGTRGLYASFTANQSYANSDWIVTLPNTESSNYAQSYAQFVRTITDLRSRTINERQDVDEQQLLYGASDSLSAVSLAIARADLSEVDAQIRERSLYAPFRGTLGMIDISEGDVVASGDVVATVIGKDSSYVVKLKVPEGSIIKVSPGQKVELELDADDSVTYTGEVVSVSRSETYIEGIPVYETVVRFEDSDAVIRSGMNVVARIITDIRSDVLAVPLSAVEFEDEKAFVVIAETEERREITLGLKGSDDYFEVIAGLEKGEQIIVQKSSKK